MNNIKNNNINVQRLSNGNKPSRVAKAKERTPLGKRVKRQSKNKMQTIESTTYKFAKCLKKRFGDDIFIKLDGHDRNYISNSYHLPVFEKIDIFSKLSTESEFQRLSPGGAISYGETANLQGNIDAVLTVIQFIYDHIMYAELNTKSDYCQKCGYDGEILIDDNMNWYCPNCGNRDQNTMNVARRTCGQTYMSLTEETL